MFPKYILVGSQAKIESYNVILKYKHPLLIKSINFALLHGTRASFRNLLYLRPKAATYTAFREIGVFAKENS